MIQPFPKPQQVKSRLPKVRAVTIAIGFHCSDGVVLCADQQITSTGWHKFYESKFFVINGDADRYCVVLTYAGDPHLIRSIHQKFASELFSQDQVESKSIQECLERKLAELPETAAESIDILCGFSVRGAGMGLLRTNKYSVYGVNYDHIGAGDSSLIRFLSKLLVPNGVSFVWPAVALGNYIVQKAKDFVDGCGGATETYIIRSDGKAMPPWFHQVEAFSRMAQAIEHDIGGISVLLANKVEERQVQKFVDALNSRVKEMLPKP